MLSVSLDALDAAVHFRRIKGGDFFRTEHQNVFIILGLGVFGKVVAAGDHGFPVDDKNFMVHFAAAVRRNINLGPDLAEIFIAAGFVLCLSAVEKTAHPDPAFAQIAQFGGEFGTGKGKSHDVHSGLSLIELIQQNLPDLVGRGKSVMNRHLADEGLPGKFSRGTIGAEMLLQILIEPGLISGSNGVTTNALVHT